LPNFFTFCSGYKENDWEWEDGSSAMILLAFGMILRVLGGIELLLIGTGLPGLEIGDWRMCYDSVDKVRLPQKNLGLMDRH